MSTSTNNTTISYIAEVTPGVTPATPAFQILPTLGGGPQGNLSTQVSEAINQGRQIDDLIVVDSEVGGPIDFELSYTPYSPLLEALMQSAAVVDSFVAVDISVTAISGADCTIDSAAAVNFTSGNLVVDQHVKITGFTAGNAAANGIYRIKSIAATQLSADRVDNNAVAVNATAGDSVTVAGNRVRNGVATPTNYTICKRVEGLAATAYMYYRGMQVSMLSLAFETGSILKGSMDFVGLTEDVTETAIASQTFTPVPSYNIMNSVTSIANIDVTGLPAGTEFSNFNLSYDNNINRAKSIGTLGASSLASFTLNLTADITIYFEDISAYNAFKNSTSFSVTLLVQDASNNNMVFRIPNCKFETLETPIPGKDNFFMLNGSLRGLRDATNNYTFQIDLL